MHTRRTFVSINTTGRLYVNTTIEPAVAAPIREASEAPQGHQVQLLPTHGPPSVQSGEDSGPPVITKTLPYPENIFKGGLCKGGEIRENTINSSNFFRTRGTRSVAALSRISQPGME
jgi:hypothetical protein